MSLTDLPYSIDFKYFYQVYDENKDKIHMKEEDGIGQHPMNQEAVARWVERIATLEDEEERDFYLFFAKVFISILEKSYITYPTFVSRIHTMAEEILQKILTEDYTYIIFILSGEVSKSNLWVSLLCMDYWNKNSLFFKFASRISIVSAPPDSKFRAGGTSDIGSKKTLFLHFDDMSYSGGQVAQAIRNLWGTPEGYTGRPKLSSPLIDYYLAIPYITDFAWNYIRTNNRGVKKLKSTYLVPSFLQEVTKYHNSLPPSEKAATEKYLINIYNMCTEKWFYYSSKKHEAFSFNNPPRNEYEKGVWAFHCSSFKSLIYFDHKLADEASIFQKVLFFGSYPINTEETNPQAKYSRPNLKVRGKYRLPVCEHESLIQGCAIDPKVLESLKQEQKNACRNYIQYGPKKWNINQNVVCPKTFYKGISYTFSIQLKRDRSGLLHQEPFLLTANSTLYDSLTYYLESVLFDIFDTLYPEKKTLDDAEKTQLFEDQFINAFSTKLERLDDEGKPAHPWQNYNNIGLNKALEGAPIESRSFFSRMVGSVLPFSGGKSRRNKRRKSKATRKH